MHDVSRRKTLILAAALLMLAVPAQSQELKKIAIGQASGSFPGSTARMAAEMGFFKKYGLDATVTPMESGAVATSGLISGSLNFTTTAAADAILAQTRGQKVVGVNAMYGNFAGVLVLASDIAKKTGVSPTAPVNERLKALNGLIIAAPAASSSLTIAVKLSAEAAGANPRFTYMGQNVMIAALESGAIQGFIAASPFYALPVLKNTGVMWVSGPKGEFPSQFTPANASVLFTTPAYAEANPDVIKNVRAAIADFSKTVAERPADVKAVILKMFPGIDNSNLDLIFSTEAPGFQVKPLSKEDMAQEIKFVKATGVDLPKVPEPEELLVAPAK